MFLEIKGLLVVSFPSLLQKRADRMFWCAILAAFFCCLLELCSTYGHISFVPSSAERKLVMVSLSNLMRAMQMLPFIQGCIRCSWQQEKQITHMDEGGRSTNEGWLLRHHSIIKRFILEVSYVITMNIVGSLLSETDYVHRITEC